MIMQARPVDNIILQVDGYEIGFVPPPLDARHWERLIALYREQRQSLVGTLMNVTGWI